MSICNRTITNDMIIGRIHNKSNNKRISRQGCKSYNATPYPIVVQSQHFAQHKYDEGNPRIASLLGDIVAELAKHGAAHGEQAVLQGGHNVGPVSIIIHAEQNAECNSCSISTEMIIRFFFAKRRVIMARS
jgi:hypothetical protein